MKQRNRIFITAALTLMLHLSFAQTINWKALPPAQKHIVNLNAGFDNGTMAGLGYGYRFNTKLPLVLSLDYSMPFGNKPFDDFKTRLGGQLALIQAHSFFATVKAAGVIRRYQNDLVRMFNFGSEFSATAGIYKKRWFAAAEGGVDKAIITHIKHSALMKQYNPGVETGWYIPTGGNLFYGVQLGRSFKKADVYAKLGRTLSQDFKTTSLFPIYFQLGFNIKW